MLVCVLIAGARAGLAGGREAGEDQRFCSPVVSGRWLLLPSPQYFSSLEWSPHQSEKLLNFKSFFFIFKRELYADAVLNMAFD